MRRRGPIEDGSWPAQLDAVVGDPNDPSRLHGYDAWGDLAVHYGFAEIVLTALRGTTPDGAEGRAFELALALIVPASIAEASVHATALSHMLSAPAASVVATGALGITEYAQSLVASHRAWIDWLEDSAGEPPSEFSAASESDRASARTMRALVDAQTCPALHRVEPTTEATIFALLHAAGLRGAHHFITAFVTARLPATIAEALAHPPGDQRKYPMQLPPFEYEEASDE